MTDVVNVGTAENSGNGDALRDAFILVNAEFAKRGVADGYASLGSNGLVPTGQLPSYVDTVIEYATYSAFPATGASGSIYLALDTGFSYRWSGTVYVNVSGTVNSVNGQTGTVTLTASGIGSSAVGGVSATTVQAAIAELDAEKTSAATLAASGGAALVGFIQSGTGAVARTVQDKARERVSVKDFLPQGHAIDGSVDYSTHVTASLAEANAAGKKLKFPNFPLKFTVTTGLSVEIECEPGFVALAANAADVAALRFVGAASATTYQLNAPVVRGAKSITVAAPASDIAAGDFFVLQDDAARTSDGAKQINMEIHQAKSVVGATITLFDFVRESKAVTATNVYKVTMLENPVIRGWRYEGLPGTTANIGLFFDMCHKPRVYGFFGRNGVGDAISFRRCFDVLIEDWDVAEPQGVGSGQGYGPSFAQGTTKIHLGSGVGKGMRHTVDFDSCWDVTSDWFDSIGNVTSADVMLAHNGWGGDFQDLKFRVRGGTYQSAYISVPSNSASIYSKPISNINLTVDSELPLASGAYGFYSEQPVLNSDITVSVLQGDGSKPTSFTSSTAAVRMPPSGSKGTKVKINAEGAVVVFSRIGTSETTYGDATFDITAKNCYQAALVQNSPELNICNLDVDNIHSTVIGYSGANTLKKINVQNATLKNTTSALTDIVSTMLAANGSNGRFGPVFDDASAIALTLSAGFALTLDQILKAQDGSTFLVTAASAVTSDATAFEKGIFTGQMLTLSTDQTANTITIQHSVQVQNNGGTSVVLGTSKRSATWVYNASIGRWYQVV